jgi:drug/metabolite transporter (DMT)-like permease
MPGIGERRSAAVPLATTILLWAAAFSGIRAGLSAYSPAQLAALRCAIAAIAFLVYGLVTRKIRVPSPRDLPQLIVLGAVGMAVYHLALSAGEQTLSAASTSFLINTVPVFTALWAVLILQEPIRLLAWVGLAVSFGGAALIAIGESRTAAATAGYGAPLVLVAALCQSLYFIGQKRLFRASPASRVMPYTPLEVTAYAVCSGALLLLPFLWGLTWSFAAAHLHATLAIVYLGILPGAVGFVAYAYALDRLPASRATAFLYLVPVVAIPIGWAWLGELPSATALIGGGVVMTGVLISRRS